MFPPSEGTRPPGNPNNQSPRGFENPNMSRGPRIDRSYYQSPPPTFYAYPGGHLSQCTPPQNPYLYPGPHPHGIMGYSQRPSAYQQYYPTYDPATPNGKFGTAPGMNMGQAHRWVSAPLAPTALAPTALAHSWVSAPLAPTAAPYVPVSERQHWQQAQAYGSPVASSQSPYDSPAPAQRYVQGAAQNQTPKRSPLRATAPAFYPAQMQQIAAQSPRAEIEKPRIIQQSARAKIYEQMPVPANEAPMRRKKGRAGFMNGNQRPEVVIRECNGQNSSIQGFVADARHKAMIPPQPSNSPRLPLTENTVQSLPRRPVGQWKEFEEDMPAPRGSERRAADPRRFMEDDPEYDDSPLRSPEMDPVLEFDLARAHVKGYARYNPHGPPASER
ncbi:hypothetical protein N7486_008052 [Penicillium sp. IBT 16267x]|nr:hypothetical protein N7486_008052 [Penicillium sp. IBT 16267x]